MSPVCGIFLLLFDYAMELVGRGSVINSHMSMKGYFDVLTHDAIYTRFQTFLSKDPKIKIKVYKKYIAKKYEKHEIVRLL